MGEEDFLGEAEALAQRKPKKPKKKEATESKAPEQSAPKDELQEELDLLSQRGSAKPKKKVAVSGEGEVAADAEEPAEAQLELAAAEPEPVEEEVQIYEVKRGDSLSKIAEKVYGDGSRWREIYKANKDKIKDPRVIHKGQKLRIP